MNDVCNSSYKGCALIIGVVGLSDRLSSYRIKAFYGINKLKVGVPVNNSPYSVKHGDATYDYFWFSINATVIDSSA